MQYKAANYDDLHETAKAIDEHVRFDFDHYEVAMVAEFLDDNNEIDACIIVEFALGWNDDGCKIEMLHLIDYIVENFDLAYNGMEIGVEYDEVQMYDLEFIDTENH